MAKNEYSTTATEQDGPPAFRLDGHTALIVGAGRPDGIGFAAARALSASGATAALADLPDTDVETLATGLSGRSTGHRVNVTDELQCDRLVSEVVERHGRIDVLVYAAGFLSVGHVLSQQTKDWKRTFEVNVFGALHVGRAAARRMAERGDGGAIVYVSSINAFRPRPNNAAYNASKAALNQVARSMAVELAPHGIRVNVLCPGSTSTAMLKNVQTSSDPERLDAVVKGSLADWRLGIPLGGLADPADQAAAIVYLASPAARHVTGQLLCVDGGQGIV